MLKRICLFMAAISFSALYAISALAQSCDLAPTCAELGFTQTTSECRGKKTLICPFDKTAVFCGSFDGSKVCDGEAIALQIDASAGGKISFNFSGGDVLVDWGDETNNKTDSHTYTNEGTYEIRICGTITSFSVASYSSINEMKMLSLDLSSITKMDFSDVRSILTGTIPNFPPNLIDGENMFYSCSGLTGDIPPLPDSLTNGYMMFRYCSGLNGKITSFGTGLTNGYHMFSSCSSLTGSIPPLPDSLTDGTYMFNSCYKLTGDIPALPDGLTNGNNMFSSCSKLTGITSFGKGLTNGQEMFRKCSGLTGDIPPLPDSLTNGYMMFRDCSGLSGQTPIKPSQLISYTDIFANTQVTNDGSWPSSAW